MGSTELTREPRTKEHRPVAKDAIVLLKEDHKSMRTLFRQYRAAGGNATAAKAKLAKRIVQELTTHTYLENECMYPEVRALLPDVEDDVLESYEEHHVADVLCLELVGMKPTDERFDAKMTVLMEIVEHHMEEEESEWFPKVRAGLGRTRLGELGDRMLEMKRTAPRNPLSPRAMKKAADAVVA